MSQEQEIRAKALEIAVLSMLPGASVFSLDGASFNPPGESRVRRIENYIRNGLMPVENPLPAD